MCETCAFGKRFLHTMTESVVAAGGNGRPRLVVSRIKCDLDADKSSASSRNVVAQWDLRLEVKTPAAIPAVAPMTIAVGMPILAAFRPVR